MRNTAKSRVLFVVPLPPPIAGPELSSQLLLESSLKDDYEIIRLKLNVHTSNDQKGSVSVTAILAVAGSLLRLVYLILRARPACVYTTLNQNVSGFLRDSLTALITKAFGLKLVLHFRGSNFMAFHDRQPELVRRYIRFVLKLADRIILQAYWLKGGFQRFVPPSKLCVIYNGIDAGEFARGQDDGPTRNGETNVLFLNHLSVAKGFVDFLTAAKRIVARRPDVHFFIAGDVIGQEKNILLGANGKAVEFIDIARAVESVERDERFNRQIHVLGEISSNEEKLRLFRDSDIFVLPSYSEGCPLSVLEAMAAGLPVIVTRVGALTEIIQEGRNGLFVAISDPDELERQILRLVDDPVWLRKIGETNRALVRSRFDIELIAKEFSKLLRSLLLAEASPEIGVDALFACRRKEK